MKPLHIHLFWILVCTILVLLLYTPLGNEFVYMIGMLIIELLQVMRTQWQT